jgi:peroxiredoxin
MRGKTCGVRVFLIACLCVAASTGVGSTLAQSGWIAPAPPFRLPDLHGEYHHSSEYRGKVLIVNFWASWCAPCREELPSMNRAWAELQDESVVMLAINVGEDREAVLAFNRDYPIDFQVLLDSYGNISQRWRVVGMPTTFLVNRKGKIIHRIAGKREWDSEELLGLVRGLE